MLADTQILIWALVVPGRLSASLRDELDAMVRPPSFSSISIWEIAIKAALGRADFLYDPEVIRQAAFDRDWTELPFTGEHAVAVRDLPPIHADPFDRALLAQAIVEGVELVTADKALAGYGAPVRGM
jgi:PIN domain nuclease of toxin-antitoxin system